MFDFATRLRADSALKYGIARVLRRRSAMHLRAKLGFTFEMQPPRSNKNDYGIAYEIFVHEYFRPPAELADAAARLIVDCGANVGYSVLYWASKFPSAQIIAFEPHPESVAQAARNIAANHLDRRVQLHARAVGARAASVRLSDAGAASSVLNVAPDDRGAFTVEMIDVFPLLAGKRIDILKIDIEGGEYEILADPRFEALQIGAIVMEWHGRGDPVADRRWCEQRLGGLGFAVREIATMSDYGMFWALRR